MQPVNIFDLPKAILHIDGDGFFASCEITKIYVPNFLYRATGIVLCNLETAKNRQLDLFGKTVVLEKYKKIFESMDEIDARYGKHSVFLGTSFLAMKGKQHEGERGIKSERRKILFKGEDERKRICVPFMGEAE